MLRVQRLEAIARDVRIDLRGGDVGVTEQQLHHAQVGAVIDQVCGERVAQRALDRSTDKERAHLQTLLNRVLENLRQPA